MSDQETAEHIRKWVRENYKFGIFSWPTDGCGYEQHIRFVKHRNKNWTEEREKKQTFEEFCLEYAAALEEESHD